MKTKKSFNLDPALAGLIPPFMTLFGILIVFIRYRKLDSDGILNLFSNISYHMIIPIISGVVAGVFSGMVPHIIPIKWKYVLQERQSLVWKIALPVLFLIGALPFFGLIKSLEWMILLGIFVVVTSLFHLSIHSAVKIYRAKKINLIRKLEEQDSLGGI